MPDTDEAVRLDEHDRRVLSAMQEGFPLSATPFADIAGRTGLDEQEVLNRVRSLRERGVIRRIGGVLDSRKLGLVGTLVAARVPNERIDTVAETINALPNCTHNYLRDHDYNMWFTLTAASTKQLDALIERVKQHTGIADMISLPSTKTYKINVRLDFEE